MVRFLNRVFRPKNKPARPMSSLRAQLSVEALERRENPAPWLPGKTFLLADYAHGVAGASPILTHVQFASQDYRPDLTPRDLGGDFRYIAGGDVYHITGTLEDTSHSSVGEYMSFDGWLVDLGDGTNMFQTTAYGADVGSGYFTQYTDNFNGFVDDSGTSITNATQNQDHYYYYRDLNPQNYHFYSYYDVAGVYIGDNVGW
jgi:hypothetical protein